MQQNIFSNIDSIHSNYFVWKTTIELSSATEAIYFESTLHADLWQPPDRELCAGIDDSTAYEKKRMWRDILIEMNTIFEARIIEIIPSRLTPRIHDGMALFLYKWPPDEGKPASESCGSTLINFPNWIKKDIRIREKRIMRKRK